MSVINTATNHVIATIGVGGYPAGVAVSPDGTRAYVTNETVGHCVGDQHRDQPRHRHHRRRQLPGRGGGQPDGTRAYVTNPFSGSVSVINTATNHVTATIGVASDP